MARTNQRLSTATRCAALPCGLTAADGGREAERRPLFKRQKLHGEPAGLLELH